MAKPATQSAVLDLGEQIVMEMKGVFSSAGVTDSGAKVHTEDMPYNHFPHAIVIFPDEGRSQPTETKGTAPVVNFPQVNIYGKNATSWEQVTKYANDLIQRVTAPTFTVSGWTVAFNTLQFNQRNSTSPSDEEPIISRSVQFQIHLEAS